MGKGIRLVGCDRSSTRRLLCTNVLVYARAYVAYRSDENNYAH